METPIEKVLKFLLTVPVFFWLKLLVLAGLMVYILFALLVVKQVKIMGETVNNGGINILLTGLAWLHLGAAIFIFVMALVLL
jgi:hypothetical protein